ncbi:NCK-interacting protein with SH3 domain [Planococcus citri]|uniref:NCK-interacting protein with SH3 domain n=1 Tax=Planococcus citri TaxID=170843 RepID=UPI0031F8F03D
MENQTPCSITEEQVYKMIERVRCETHLSHKLATHAVNVVLENFSTLAPPPAVQVITEILSKLEVSPEAPLSLIDNTQDMTRLFVITEDLASVKDDAQQRSWELFDDQASIVEYLREFNCILTDADTAISKRFLHITDYYIVNCLAEYYQMETRWLIRNLLLQSFDLLCTLSRTAILVLIASVLPLELTRDVQNNINDKDKLLPVINVLTKIFSIGERLPIIYFDTIGKEFILQLLNLIESPSDDPDQEDIVIDLVNLILVYNLQFDENRSISDNLTIQALSQCDNPKIFSETLLLLFNRGKDPAKFLDHQPSAANSLLKIITDIFASDETSNLFYKNDVAVLIDIVLRNLVDNSPNYEERNEWLKLILRILQKIELSDYADKISKIQSCIEQFSKDEERKDLDQDCKLIADIEYVLSQRVSS